MLKLLAQETPLMLSLIADRIILSIHEAGQGLFGCGPLTREGMIMVEAVRWIITILNKDNGQSFLPGVLFDVKVFDSCGHPLVAAEKLAEFYPSLKEGKKQITQGLKLGLVDGTGLSKDQEVQAVLDANSIPVVSFTTAYVSAKERIQVIRTMIKKLQWHHVAVMYGDDDQSSQMFSELISDEELCIVSADKFSSPSTYISSGKYLNYNQTLSSVIGLRHPLIVLMSYTEYPAFIKSLSYTIQSDKENTLHHKQIQILFSDLLTHEDLELFPKDSFDVFSLTLPEYIPEFELHWWQHIQQVMANSNHVSEEDKWLADYFELHACRESQRRSDSPECDDLLDVALRTRAVVQASSAVLVLANALREAWRVKCSKSNHGGDCPLLQELPQQEYLQHYVQPLKEEQNMFKLRKEILKRNSTASRNFILINYLNLTSDLLEVMVYSSSEGLHVLDDSFNRVATNVCEDNEDKSKCKECLYLKQDRSNSSRHFGYFTQRNQNLPYLQSKVSKYQLQPQSNYNVLISSPQNVYIAALFSLHKSANQDSFLHCKDDEVVDLDTVRKIEAFLWALQRVNFHLLKYSASDLQIGALLVDTCNSHVRTMALTAGLDSFNHHVGGYQILAAVNALPFEDAKIADEILSSLNITTLSIGQSAALADKNNENNTFILQVEAPTSAIVDAIISVMKHHGWDYISIVYSTNAGELESGFKQFQTVATTAGICFAVEEAIDSDKEQSGLDELVTRLVGARAAGARAVLLWTNSQDTKMLMQAVGQALGHGTLRREDLFWLLASPDRQTLHVLQQAGNLLGGALVFSPQHKHVPEFLKHLHHIQLESKSTSTNPWLKQYYKEILQCNTPQCQLSLEENAYLDFNTIQAVYSAGAAISQMLSELCSNVSEVGHCFSMFNRKTMKLTFNKYVLQSITQRADTVITEDFLFTNSGVSNIAVEILNFRRKFKERSRSLGDVYYDRVGTYVNGTLKTLDRMVAYRDAVEEIEISALTSQCGTRTSCSRCQGRHNKLASLDWMSVIPNSEKQKLQIKLTIAATFDIHEPSQHPLECSSVINKKGIEQLEAFLWAVEQVNLNNTHLSIGAIALDSCGSVVKTSRDISDFLSMEETNDISKIPTTSNNVIAFVAGGGTELAGSVMEAVGHLKIPVLVPQAGGPSPQRKKFSPYPLQLASTNTAQASAILSLLHHLKWSCFSVVYYQDGVEYEDIFRYIEKHVSAPSSTLNMSLSIPIPLGAPDTTSHVREILKKLQQLKTSGNKVIILLLPSHRIEVVLRTAQALEDEGQLTPGALTWITLGSQEILETYSEQSIGAIVLQSSAGRIPEFEEYFKNLNLASNTRNPWFSQFWSDVFHCRGAMCFNKLYQDLQSYQFNHNPPMVNTINSVLAVAHALETVRREICPDSVLAENTCRAMKDIDRVRHRLFEVTPHMAFVGVGLNAVAFSSAGENTHTDIEILNYHRHGEKGFKLETVGYIQSSGLIHFNLSKAKGYTVENKAEVSLHNLNIQCSVHTSPKKEVVNVPLVMEVPSNNKLTLLAVMPVHLQGEGQFDCGRLQTDAMLHAAAFRFALEQINRNSSLLPGIKLGAILLDSCSRSSYVYSSIYNFLSTSADNSASQIQGSRPEDTVAALMFDLPSTETVVPLLEAQNIMQVLFPMEESLNQGMKLSNSKYMEYLLDSENIIEAMLSVIRASHSHSVVVIREASSWAEMVTQQLQNHTLIHNDLCLAGIYTFHSKNMDDLIGAISSTNMMVTKDITKKLRPGTTVILLLEDPKEIQAFLNVCHTISGLVFLTVLQSVDVKLITDNANIITLSPEFRKDRNGSFPTDEFYDWISSNFLRISPHEQRLFPPSWINELQAVNNTTIKQKLQSLSLSLQDTMNVVSAIAAGLHQFLNIECAHRFETASFLECRDSFTRRYKNLHDDILNIISLEYRTKNFIVWKGIKKAGSWNHGIGLQINNPDSFSNVYSDCSSMDCTECAQETEIHQISEMQPTIYHNLQYAWASILGGFTLLGAFLTIMTALYFLAAAALPHTNLSSGTSVLGYLILLGTLLLFISNLNFVLAPTPATCGARRFLPGLSYALIFGGMLLKVTTTWRRIEGELIEDGLGRPSNLLVAAVILTLVQVLLSGGWLLLIPPQVYTIASKDSVIWRCYPRGNFETHLLLSLFYIILLLSATSVVALLCCSSSKRKVPEEGDLTYDEAKWILIASMFVAAVFTFWGITTMVIISLESADFASAVAHLTAAIILLLTLYVPKIRLYSRLKSNKVLAQPSMPPIYDVSNFHPPTMKTIPAFIAPAAPVIGLDLPPVEDEDPTQVIPSSLYSLDMFSQSSSSQEDGEEGDHCEPGTNEFTVPHSAMLVGEGDRYSLQATSLQICGGAIPAS
ncbi:uncharacterized protein [Anabrus simplex]|uniref:uncharacterized protein n=1 Tax=Anabrus simplex TaxID=316456 RepID=UPI0035A33379